MKGKTDHRTQKGSKADVRRTASKSASSHKALVKSPGAVLEVLPEQSFVPYDENLLERARTQWQFGDWESLARLDRDTLQHHPDRAKLALLAAAGRLQIGKDAEARQFLRVAQDWGVSKKLLIRILAAGVHNSLGRAAAVAGDRRRTLKHFEAAILTGSPGSDVRLLTQARVFEQCRQLDVAPTLLDVTNTLDS